MPDPARKSLTVLKDVHAKAMTHYEIEKKTGRTNQSFIKWVSEYLEMNLERDEFLKEYTPFLEMVGITDNRLTIRDKKTNKITDVFLRDGKLYCTLDEKDDCIHIHFTLGLPELAKLKKN